MQLVILVLFLFFSVWYAFGDPRANNYMDNFLSTAFASEVRSLHLEQTIAPDFEVEIEEQVRVLGRVRGRAEFWSGTLEGLAHARRQSECESILDTGYRFVNCSVGFNRLKVKYSGKLKYGLMPKMSFKGKAKISATHFFLEIDQNIPMQPIVRNFTCTQAGAVHVKFMGLGPLNRFMSILEEGYMQHIQDLISGDMTQKLRYSINRALSKDLLLF